MADPMEYGGEFDWRSPNFGNRPANAAIRLIVLHADADTKGVGTLRYLCTKGVPASYHGLIAPSGTWYQLVDAKHRAWHAGVAEWNGVTDVNSISLGLAFDNPQDGVTPLTGAQIRVAKAVIQGWLQRYPTIEAIVTHREIAPTRRQDPHLAPNFFRDDWTVEALR
jgi:N-acetylmuramoyl-L-alanine amidase